MPYAERLMAAGLSASPGGGQGGAFFRTEIGPLNQVVCIWARQDDAHFSRWTADLPQLAPALSEYLVESDTRLLRPAPFMRDWVAPLRLGGVYELRTYDLVPGSEEQVFASWATKIAERERLSPLAGCWVDTPGGNKLFHLWPYADLLERERIRKLAVDEGVWPTDAGEHYVRQESKVLVPMPFSLLQ